MSVDTLEAQTRPPAPEISEQPRPWERDRTNDPSLLKRWQRLLMHPKRSVRYTARVATAAAIGLGAAGLVSGLEALPGPDITPGLEPHPTPGPPPIPPSTP